MNYGHFAEVVARQKVHGTEAWKAYSWECIDGVVESGMFKIKGGVPVLLQKGPRKGRETWKGKPDVAYVTKAECETAHNEYESTTGNCGHCLGKGQEMAGWSVGEGTRYRDCSRCKGSGKKQEAK